MKKIITLLTIGLLIGPSSSFAQPFKDLMPGPHPESSTPDAFINVGSKMFFVTAYAPLGGAADHQLWVSDGTVGGTIMLKDSLIITNLAHPVVPRVDVNGILYFTVGGIGCSTCNMELWKSDGTPGGTVMITTLSFDVFSGGASPNNFVALGSNCIFSFGNGTGRELWISDGTAAGTHIITDLTSGSTGGVVDQQMMEYNGKIYFCGSTNGFNNELFSTDGTAAGTTLVSEINSSGFAGSDPGSWMVYNSLLFFSADNGTDEGLWKTDGSGAGTVQVYAPISFSGAQIFNGEMYFLGWNASAGMLYPLWKSDGTTPGTTMVRDSMGSIHGMNTNYLFTSYYTLSPPYVQIFKRTDGTFAGTNQVSYNIGATASFASLGDNMYTSRLDSGTTNIGVWVTDGTAAGTSEVLSGYGTGPVHKYNNAIWFSNFESGTGYELWTLNGISSVNNYALENNLLLYPNPANENINIEIADETEGTVEILNMNGAVISTQKFVHQKMIINVSELSQGVYLVRVCTPKGYSVRKLIKN